MADPNTVTDMASTLPLADIHLPSVPGYWPLAWGWWLCIAFVLSAIAVATLLLIRRQQRQQARKEAIQQLRKLNDPACFNDINLLLRQTAMSYYPRQQVAGLTGGNWLAFLDSHLDKKQRGFVALSDSWQQGLFSPHGADPDTFDQCYRQAFIWLKKARLPSEPDQKTTAPEVKDA